MLRHVKDAVGAKNLSVYVSLLSYMVGVEGQLGLLANEHVLDLYVYYSQVALESPNPRVRVCGLSIMSTLLSVKGDYEQLTENPALSERMGNLEVVDASLEKFESLAKHDKWWEVQAQLLILSCKLIDRKLKVL